MRPGDTTLPLGHGTTGPPASLSSLDTLIVLAGPRLTPVTGRRRAPLRPRASQHLRQGLAERAVSRYYTSEGMDGPGGPPPGASEEEELDGGQRPWGSQAPPPSRRSGLTLVADEAGPALGAVAAVQAREADPSMAAVITGQAAVWAEGVVQADWGRMERGLRSRPARVHRDPLWPRARGGHTGIL